MSARRPLPRGGKALPTLLGGLRAAVSSLGENPGVCFLANLVLVLAAALGALARVPAAVLLVGLLLVPVGCGVMRMACHVARGYPARLSHLLDGARHRFWRHLALGAAQLLLLAGAFVNITLGVQAGGFLFGLAATVAGYAVLATCSFAAVVWPLLLDPERRDLALPDVLRSAAVVVMTRPMGVIALAAVEGVMVVVSVQTVVPALLLPSFGALVAAHYVLPLADRLPSRKAPGR